MSHEGVYQAIRRAFWLFTRSPAAIIAAIVAVLSILGAVLAPLIAPANPYDLASFSLMDGLLPPVWEEFGNPKFYWEPTIRAAIWCRRSSMVRSCL